jgi:hypothetical protein
VSYVIIERDRDISFGIGDNARFVISPAKVKVNKLKSGQTFKIDVAITNKGERMTFGIKEEQPPKLDIGYVDALEDYECKFSDTKIIVEGYSTQTVSFSVKRVSKNDMPKQEKGFLIAQTPEDLDIANRGTIIARGYIFEVLLPEDKKIDEKQ